ncbi:putative adenine methyltransferase [Salmonella phage 41]|nr:putative adenine methyltransferase [Salmonella phage 41]
MQRAASACDPVKYQRGSFNAIQHDDFGVDSETQIMAEELINQQRAERYPRFHAGIC